MTIGTATLITAEKFDALGDIGTAELVRGKVVPLTKPKPKHGRIAMRIGRKVGNFVERKKLGEVYAAETGFLVERNPDSVRAPDVSFVRTELALGHDEDEWYPHSPDLAVEVLSPGDRPGAVEEKVQMWLDGGGRSVWVVDPATRSVIIRRPGGNDAEFWGNAILKDESVLPGFSMRLRSIFDR